MRINRLAAPAYAAAALGLIMLLTASMPYFQLTGGIAMTGGYTVALQLVLASSLLAAIDDFDDPGALSATGGRVGLPEADRTTPLSSRNALLRFYLRRPGPALLAGFGSACSLSAIMIGLLDHGNYAVEAWGLRYSELAMAVILPLTALPQLVKRGLGFFGWCWGMAAGVVLAQTFLDQGIERVQTILGWAGEAGVISLLGLVVKGIQIVARRRIASDEGRRS
ncbi:hypothetical protein ACGFMK_24385 [Amycolatopsis sp. NPDC049252]|uniref:hypothetical protein n=1 Tax=Amycolatopsis sp. NPDC049252 TaxID=3363933 RepID=UPI0037121543